MTNIGKIGCAIITHNRSDFLIKILESIPKYVDLFVINTGEKYDEEVYSVNSDIIKIHQFDKKTCVGHGKNAALKIMLEHKCDHLFTMEDDVYIKDPMVFYNYIKASYESGIKHLNFGFSQKENLDKDFNPVYKLKVDYTGDISIVLTPNILGAFTYYQKEVIEKIGLHDEAFDHNHMDHVELTLRANKAGYCPPFWWFADLCNSHLLIESQKDAINNSSTSKNTNEWLDNVQKNAELYKQKNGHFPAQTPLTSQENVLKSLKQIKLK